MTLMNQKSLALSPYFLIACFATAVLADEPGAVAQESIRDVRPPVYFPTNYFLLFGIFFLVSVAAIVVFVFLKRKRRGRAVELPVDTRLPWEIALDQLDQLARRPYLQEGRFKEYYSELSGIIRYYFENRFKIRAPEMTTEEFLWSLERSREFRGGRKETLRKFMTSCDMIKFARHVPLAEEAAESFRFARQLVEETKTEDDI